MKVVILAGGRGIRIAEETEIKPKPMVEIGGRPILWHIMKIYSYYGFNDFIVCLGYRGNVIKNYFSQYYMNMSSLTIDLGTNRTKIHATSSESWKVTLADTGNETMTGGRLWRIKRYLKNETFMMTYGDGVGNVDIKRLIETHKRRNTLATLTAVQTAGRFGVISIDKKGNAKSFLEKPVGEGSWINSGFFVLDPGVFDYIEEDDSAVWEREPLERLAQQGELSVHKHEGFWKPLDTLRDKIELENLWQKGEAPWKIWK